MVLAEFIKFKHGLYKSCGIECFEGIMLVTCLLQPYFHVAGILSASFILGFHGPVPRKRRAASAHAHKLAYVRHASDQNIASLLLQL